MLGRETILAELKAHIESAHAEDWKAFERLSARLLKSSTQAALVPSPQTSEPVRAEAASTESLIGSVEHVFLSHPDNAWSVVTLAAQLQKDGFVFEAKNPKSSINTALSRLTERNVIAIYKRGSGRKPSLYKAFPNGNAAALRGRLLAIEDRPLISNNNESEEIQSS